MLPKLRLHIAYIERTNVCVMSKHSPGFCRRRFDRLGRGYVHLASRGSKMCILGNFGGKCRKVTDLLCPQQIGSGFVASGRPNNPTRDRVAETLNNKKKWHSFGSR